MQVWLGYYVGAVSLIRNVKNVMGWAAFVRTLDRE